MGKWSESLGFALILFAAASSVAGAAELRTTNPAHYANPGETLSPSDDWVMRRTKQVRAGSHVIVRDAAVLHQNWVLSQDLSRACNKRQFRQRRDQFLIGVVDGRTYGAAVGGDGSLVDRGKMAENKVVYLFKGQGTTDCRVYHRTK